MSNTVERLSSTRVKLTIEVPFDQVKPALAKAYRELASRVSIPGFRQGHVPPAIIDQRLGRGVALSEAINALLPEVYTEAVEQNQLVPLGQPEIDITKLEEGQTVTFTAEVDVRPDFDLPDPRQIAVTVDPVGSTEQGVAERLDLLRQRFAETSQVDRAGQPGDQVTIDLVAAQDGADLADATAEAVTYVIGQGGLLDGLDEAVTGLAAGDSTTFVSTLVGGDHAGEVADITVTVTRVDQRTLPELDDDFAQLVSQFDTLDQMKADLATAVGRLGLAEQLAQARTKVLEATLAQTNFDLPDGAVERETASRLEQMASQLKGSGLTVADYLAQVADPDQATEADLSANIARSVDHGLRAEIVLSRVAEEAAVAVSEEDLTSFIYQQAQENGTTPDQELEHMRAHNHLAEWLGQIRQSKALDTLVAQADISDSDGAAVDLSALLSPSIPPSLA